MPRGTRREFLKASAGTTTIGLTGLAGCIGGDSSPTLSLDYVVPFENWPYFFDIPGVRENLSNVGDDYEIEISRSSSTPDSLNLMASGDADIALVTTQSYASSIIQETIPGGYTGILVDFWDAHPEHFGFEIYSRPDSGITEPEDLEGAQLGVNGLGTSVHAILILMLQDVGIDPEEDVEFVEQPFPTMYSSLEDEIIDASIFVAQFATEPRSNDYNLVFSTQDLYDEAIPSGYLVARNDTLDENEDGIAAFVEDYVNLADYSFNNRDEVISLASDFSDVPEGYLDAFLFTENDWYRTEFSFDFDRLQFVIDELSDAGITSESFSVQDYATNEYIP
ncbi:ABC transporter substrate-binding protein [Halobellus captivus]|uniref:ABC transporter substrate-binding protein n=1 Tax=Halobellus captivus TaxID=2592614 RepID=UPI0011A77880|nr:ABC transporter substrate-binding protein [Halobellus captivus]